MSFFDKFLPKAEREKKPVAIDWNPLNDLSQLEEIIRLSAGNPVWVFKHSTRCGISSMVLKNFERKELKIKTASNFFLLDLIRNREISDAIARRFSVLHQSPQLIKIENGKAVNSASHYGILEMKIDSIS